MTERVWSEKDLARRAKRRLAVLQHAEEVSGSVAATCRYYGISRTVFYRWKRCYEDEGLDGLKLDMNRLPASQRHKRHQQRWKRYEKQRPGHQLQIDVKFIEPITTGPARRKRYYQYTAIDDCTRLRVLRIYPCSGQETAVQFFD
jgi:transposase-like protein